MLSSGLFTGLCNLSANVTEHTVFSIFHLLAYEDRTDSVIRNFGT
jgi:hypothetical protein